MDNVPHATLTRKTLEEKLKEKGIRERVRIPEDGENYSTETHRIAVSAN